MGEVREINYTCVITERGTTDKQWFYIPKKEVQGYDSSSVIVRVTEEDARARYLRAERIVREPLKKPSIKVQLTHEELGIERRSVEDYRITDEKPIQSRTTIKIPLKREVIEMKSRKS